MRRANGEMLVTMELLRDLFDLPSGMAVVGARSRDEDGVVVFEVSSPAHDPVADDMPPHMLTPLYRRQHGAGGAMVTFCQDVEVEHSRDRHAREKAAANLTFPDRPIIPRIDAAFSGKGD